VSLSVVNCYLPGPNRLTRPRSTRSMSHSEVSASGEAHIPTTRIGGRVSLRACFLHYDNNEGDVDHLINLVRRLGAELRQRGA
jgi:hypothetical protein